MERKTEVRKDGKEEVEDRIEPPNVDTLIKRKRGDIMKGKIKRKHPAVWKIRHRTGGIDDHPQRYHINVAKRYLGENIRHGVVSGDYRKKKYTLSKEKLLDVLPHGSGIDGDWYIEDKGSYFYAGNSYHCMDEYGYYDGWQDFYLTIPKKDPTKFKLHFRGDQYLARKYMLRDYLEDLFGLRLNELSGNKVESGHYRIKGWEYRGKLGLHNNWWINKEAKLELMILAVPQVLGRSPYLYSVKVGERFGKKHKIIASNIQKKSEAIKFAKEWMKKHPNGV